MSFSLDLKQEILSNRPMRVRWKQAQAYGLFRFGHAYGRDSIRLRTENEETVRLFQWFARDFLGKETRFLLNEARRGGAKVQTISIAAAEDRLRLLARFGQGEEPIHRGLLTQPEALGAFLAGAYLACGNITDPEKSYHMEFVLREEALCIAFTELLAETIPGARVTRRRNDFIVYYKECRPIEDLLTLIGATKSCLAVIDVETYKSVRNRANRATNCETANIDKLVGAATSQIEDIRLLLRVKGERDLPENLLTVARLRLENPEASLRELAELSPEPISRSGIHHRLDKLTKLAAEIREQMGGVRDGI